MKVIDFTPPPPKEPRSLNEVLDEAKTEGLVEGFVIALDGEGQLHYFANTTDAERVLMLLEKVKFDLMLQSYGLTED